MFLTFEKKIGNAIIRHASRICNLCRDLTSDFQQCCNKPPRRFASFNTICHHLVSQCTVRAGTTSVQYQCVKCSLFPYYHVFQPLERRYKFKINIILQLKTSMQIHNSSMQLIKMDILTPFVFYFIYYKNSYKQYLNHCISMLKTLYFTSIFDLTNNLQISSGVCAFYFIFFSLEA